MRYINCPLCNSNSYRNLITLKTDNVLKLLDIFSYNNTKVMCNTCGLVYQNPCLDNEEIDVLYTKLARSKKGGYPSETPPEEYLYWKNLKAHDDLEWLENCISLDEVKNKRVLEIGCAEGSLLRLLKEKKWEVTGIEPTVSYAEFGRKEYGINIINGFFDNKTFPEQSFGLISMLNVMEHLPEPVSFLKSIHRILMDNSFIYIEVPNVYKPKPDFKEFIGSQHITLFSPITLKKILQNTDFEIIKIDDRKLTLKALARKKNNEGFDSSEIALCVETDNYLEISKILKKHKVKFLLFKLNNITRFFVKKVLILFVGKYMGEKIVLRIKRLKII